MTGIGSARAVRARAIVILSALLLSQAIVPARSAPVQSLPNLVPERPYDVRIGEPDEPTQQRVIRFTVAVANKGLFSLELEGQPKTDQVGSTSLNAFQCVIWTSRACSQEVPAGEFVYHAQHRHWHFNGFAKYELRKLDANGQPDYSSPDALVAGGQKVSFCLEDTDVASGATPWTNGTDWLQNSTPLYKVCAPVRQGITSWWEDVYDWGLYGQQIDISNVPDGSYALVVIANPEGRILETSYDDNSAFTRLTLMDGGTVVISE